MTSCLMRCAIAHLNVRSGVRSSGPSGGRVQGKREVWIRSLLQGVFSPSERLLGQIPLQ